jgi:hypothetical protein
VEKTKDTLYKKMIKKKKKKKKNRKRRTMEETIRPLSFGMLLPCLRIQYLLRTNDVVSMSDPNGSFTQSHCHL